MDKIGKKYPMLDIAKFIMAGLVVAIHVQPFSGDIAFFYNHYLARIADPLFFAITAFLMFKKAFRDDFSWTGLYRYVVRIAKLYACWVIIYAPIILYHTQNEAESMYEFILILLQKIFFKGPYGALWFLTALLFAIPLTFIITKYTNPYICLALSFPCFLVTVGQMEYTVLVAKLPWFQRIVQCVEYVFGWMANGLTFGFFFCAMGMFVAYQEHKKGQVSGSIWCNAIGCFISCIAVYVEASVIRKYYLGYDFAAMFFLIPATYFLLLLLIQIEIKERTIYLFLRKSSILIFTIHYGVMNLLQQWGTVTGISWSTTLLYVVVLVITLLLATVIMLLSEKKYGRWLKILY